MERKIAEQILAVAYECTRLLDESVGMIQRESPEDRKEYGRAVGWVLTAIGDRILTPLGKEHPDLVSDVFHYTPPSVPGLDKHVAEQILVRTESCGDLLDEMARIARENCGKPEERMLRHGLMRVHIELHERITDPILREHPDLLREGVHDKPEKGPTLSEMVEMAGLKDEPE